MREILKGQDLLILGLNVFLPKGYEIPPSYDQRRNLHNVDKHEKIQVQKKQKRKKPLDKEKGRDKKPEMNETKDNAKSVQKTGLNKGKRRCHNKNGINNRKANNNDNKSDYLFHGEVDLSKCERYDINYVCLPEDYQSPIASGRSELDASVLNDRFVLNPQGDQDYSKSKKMFNKYQQALFETEDEQFEVDMLLESFSSACKRFKEVYENIVENKINVKAALNIEEYFRVSHLRLIERMYGKHGLDAIEQLRNNPIVALPIMLKRLEQKHEDLKHSRLELNKVWAQDYADNHAKSLDFRS